MAAVTLFVSTATAGFTCRKCDFLIEEVRKVLRTFRERADDIDYRNNVHRALHYYSKSEIDKMFVAMKVRCSICTIELARYKPVMCAALLFSVSDDFVNHMLYGPDKVRDKPVRWMSPTLDIHDEWSNDRKLIFPNASREKSEENDFYWKHINLEELQCGFHFLLHSNPPDIV